MPPLSARTESERGRSTHRLTCDSCRVILAEAGASRQLQGRRKMRVPRSRTFSAFVLLVMGVAVSAFVVAPTAAASDQVPFAAAMTGSVTSTAPCGVLTVCSAVIDEGTATHLGLVTFTKTVTIHITFAP